MLPHRILDYKTFRGLYVLLQDKADSLGDAAIAITERILPETDSSWDYGRSQFVVLVSPGLRVLLIGTPLDNTTHRGRDRSSVRESLHFQVEFTFDPHPITVFLKRLSRQLSDPSVVIKTLRKVTRHPQPNSAYFQSELMLQVLVNQETSNSGLQEFPNSSSIHPTRQERLFHQIIAQIQDGGDLSTILSQAIEEGRNLLQVDRLLIYQFDIFKSEINHDSEPYQKWGYITYESKIGHSITPVLHLTEEKSCFSKEYSVLKKYDQGCVEAISDIEVNYQQYPCLLQLLRRYQIRAKLVVPIIIRNQSWGLIIAHQCYYPRRWLESEKSIVKRLADYLAIAIDKLEVEKKIQLSLIHPEEIDRYPPLPSSHLQNSLLENQMENRIKSEFLAAISHELRTPLTYVIGMSATLLRLAFAPESSSPHLHPEKQRKYLQKIQDSGKHLLDLINDLLDLSQLEAGKTVLNIREFTLNNLIQNCQKSLQKVARDREVKLIIDMRINPGEDELKADQSRVQQIIVNLMNNAIKFTPTGGEVTLSIWREKEAVIFQVRDTGIGIHKTDFPFLFEKFQQLETAYERQYPGMGLGLALTRQLVELHGGIIEVDSTLGIGSIFTVSLPSQIPGSPSVQPLMNHGVLKSVQQPSGTMPLGRLVLIEENEQRAWGLCDLLTAAGYQAIWLLDGSTVTQQIDVLRPLAIITETQLPDMGIHELMTILRNSTGTYKIKVLAIADRSERELFTSVPEMQPDAYLDKPLQFEQLLQTLNRLLRPKL